MKNEEFDIFFNSECFTLLKKFIIFSYHALFNVVFNV